MMYGIFYAIRFSQDFRHYTFTQLKLDYWVTLQTIHFVNRILQRIHSESASRFEIVEFTHNTELLLHALAVGARGGIYAYNVALLYEGRHFYGDACFERGVLLNGAGSIALHGCFGVSYQ